MRVEWPRRGNEGEGEGGGHATTGNNASGIFDVCFHCFLGPPLREHHPPGSGDTCLVSCVI